MVTQRFEQLPDGLRRIGDFLVDLTALRVVIEDAYAQPTRVGTDLVDVGT